MYTKNQNSTLMNVDKERRNMIVGGLGKNRQFLFYGTPDCVARGGVGADTAAVHLMFGNKRHVR